MSKEIISACVKTLWLAQEDHEKYLLRNKEVDVNVLNILDGIRYRLQKEVWLNLNKNNLHNYMNPPDLVDKGYDETDKQIDFDVLTNVTMYNSEASMLSNVTKNG